METIGARELVIGFPKYVKIAAAARGTIRIESEGQVYGVNLETGARVPPEPEQDHEAPPSPFVASTGAKIGYADKPYLDMWLWGDRPVVDDHVRGRMIMGRGDVVLSFGYETVTLLERARNRACSIEIPPVIDLADRVTGGISGNFEALPLYVEPGFLVFMRTPALLVVGVEDLERALIFDHVRWGIETVVATREPALSLPAARGKWYADHVVTDAGSLHVDTRKRSEPVRVVDRLWPPNGWATVELKNGTTMPAFPVPEGFRTLEADATIEDAFWDMPSLVDWPGVDLPDPAAPPRGYKELVTVPRLSTYAAAVDYAKRVRLGERKASDNFDYKKDLKALRGTSASAASRVLAKLVGKRNRKLSAAGVYAIPALVAIAADPTTKCRVELAGELDRVLTHARFADTRQPEVIHAFRIALPLIVSAKRVTERLARSFGNIIRALAREEHDPAWWNAAAAAIPSLPERAPDENDYYDPDEE
ncbi:MAG: hypothetical protein QM831_06640 [Kofleriaceae bacterium]